MTKKIPVIFTVKKKANGGEASGKKLTGECPAFDWESFNKTPNANKFVEKAYLAEVKKLIRELDEQKNGTRSSDLDSYESIITRALAFTAPEIKEWIDSRDWSRVEEKIREPLRKGLTEGAVRFSARENPLDGDRSKRVAVHIASVADANDPVADFLFSVLTLPKVIQPELLDL